MTKGKFSGKQTFESWKEIAAYLDRSEKTCRRWEHELDLPIHRLEKSPKARVFAYKDELDEWINKKSQEFDGLPGEKRTGFFSRSSVIIIVSILVAAGIFITVFKFLGKNESLEISVPSPDEMPSLAVVYFENKSGDEDLDNWRDALPELLTTDLSQSRFLHILRSDEIYGIYKDLNLLEAKRYSADDLRNIAGRGRVTHILKGSYIKAGENFLVTAVLINAANGETICSLSKRAVGENDIFPRVDEITREIKLQFNITPDRIANDIDEDVSNITTSSPEALKYFLQAGKYYGKGDWRKSIELWEKAVSIDPKFASAYNAMSYSYYVLGDEAKRRECRKKAMELLDHISLRESYTIREAYYSEIEGDFDKAIEISNEGLRIYPYDIGLKGRLGLLYFYVEEFDKAIEVLNQVKRLTVKTRPYYEWLSMAYAGKGLYKEAAESYQCMIDDADTAWTRNHLARMYIIQRKFDLALLQIEKSSALLPPEKNWGSVVVKGNIYLYLEKFKEVEKVYQQHLGDEETSNRLMARYLMVRLSLLQGKFKEAEVQLKKAKRLAKSEGIHLWVISLMQDLGYIYLISGRSEAAFREFHEMLIAYKKYFSFGDHVNIKYRIAIALLEMESPARAQKAEEELLECVKNERMKKLVRYYYLYLGMKELKNKNYSKSIGHLNRAIPLLPHQGVWLETSHILFFYPLASAYYLSGDIENACKEFEKITFLTEGRISYGHLYAESFYMLGKIYQQKGWKGKAIESYTKFINLWKDCDPQLQPMVEDAGKRVKELEGFD